MKENQQFAPPLPLATLAADSEPASATASVETDAERMELELQELKGQLRERFSEIAAISTLLRQQTRGARRDGERAVWLREVLIALVDTPRWWSLLPADARMRRQEQLLQRRHLFDADDYLARYPDVRASGMKGLRHYLLHGMDENRVITKKQKP